MCCQPGFHFGGELRERADSYQGIGFKNSRDTHDLQRFRLNATVDAGKWLHLFAEVQDARIFLNGPVASTNNVQDTWTLWQSYVQIGSTSRGWGDVLVGRELLRFGDERVIGPSDWTNVSRTFNVARLDLRHGQSGVSIFGGSVAGSCEWNQPNFNLRCMLQRKHTGFISVVLLLQCCVMANDLLGFSVTGSSDRGMKGRRHV
jgi:hypothetical protein